MPLWWRSISEMVCKEPVPPLNLTHCNNNKASRTRTWWVMKHTVLWRETNKGRKKVGGSGIILLAWIIIIIIILFIFCFVILFSIVFLWLLLVLVLVFYFYYFAKWIFVSNQGFVGLFFVGYCRVSCRVNMNTLAICSTFVFPLCACCCCCCCLFFFSPFF